MSTIKRPLDRAALDGAARHYADQFTKMDVAGASGRLIAGRGYVLQDMYNLTFKDEYERVRELIAKHLREGKGDDVAEDFIRREADQATPRDDAVFEQLLLEKLAVNPAGEHVPGYRGTVQIGSRVVGKRMKEVVVRRAPQTAWERLRGKPGRPMETRFLPKNVYWPVYAGELEERALGSDAVDPLPEGAEQFPLASILYANNPAISTECALLACNAIVDNLDEGTGAAIIRGYTGAQPNTAGVKDVEVAATGTLLFTLVCSDPAFGAAADDNPGGKATASAITDDSSADATGTLGYCRVSATNDGATPLDDHIDGEAGTSGADFNFNTVSIVAGSTVSLTSFTVTVPES